MTSLVSTGDVILLRNMGNRPKNGFLAYFDPNNRMGVNIHLPYHVENFSLLILKKKFVSKNYVLPSL